MTNRVHIDAPSGIVDIEGEKDFVEGMLARLFPLIEAAGFGSNPKNYSATITQDPEQQSDTDTLGSEETEAPKLKRRRSGNPPKGASCSDRMLVLKSEGFFKEQRGTPEIVAALGRKGWIHKSNQVAAAAESLFKRNLIQRTKDGKNPWKFFWDRD